MTRGTIRALAQITDEGFFEELATAVLREAHPFCASLCHPGVNADGMTRKSPLDGIAVVNDPSGGVRLVAVHHTITAPAQLAKKWLWDPAAAATKPRRQPTPPGDLIKTSAVVVEERKRSPELKATLILTTNEEPSEDLVRDVVAAGASHGIDVDIWSRSRIAHFLDTRPSGQWIRRRLDIEAELLSSDLLALLSRRSLECFRPPDEPDAWIARALDRSLSRVRQPATFLLADAGQGKTVACYRALRSHVDAGGYGLILPHELLEVSTTLEIAIGSALRDLHPDLAAGQSPFTHCTSERPFMLIVEDVNRSGKPRRLVEKVASWCAASRLPMRLICPVWPSVLALVNEQTRKATETMIAFAEPMTKDECRSAVMMRAARADRSISPLAADQIAASLGYDPLLIALHDYSAPSSVHDVIGGFVDRALTRMEADSNEMASDLRDAIMLLAEQMLRNRRLDPSWNELRRWDLPSKVVDQLGRIARGGEVMRLTGSVAQPQLQFRHDRVRDWLLAERLAELDVASTLDDELVSEPFYAEFVGAALVQRRASQVLLERARRSNPLSLFHALRLLGANHVTTRRSVLDAVTSWLSDPEIKSAARNHERWHAVAALEFADGADIPALVAAFPCETPHGHLACLHNGDVIAAAKVCARYEFGLGASFRDHQIEHAKTHFRETFLDGISEELRRAHQLAPRVRRGLLELAGHVGTATLVAALEAAWLADPSRDDHLRQYLWAFARCCNDDVTVERNLGPICDAWAALSNEKPDGKHSSPRSEFAAHDLHWGFVRTPPSAASLTYFVERAKAPELTWYVTYMMGGVDHPVAVQWAVDYSAANAHRLEDGSLYVGLLDDWLRRSREPRLMSRESREPLLDQWRDTGRPEASRKAAFRMWSVAEGGEDVSILREAQGDTVLGDAILASRLERGDVSATDLLVRKLRDEGDSRRWWHYARYVWSADLVHELERVLRRRCEQSTRTWAQATDDDYLITGYMALLPTDKSEQLLLRHWDDVRQSRRFFQMALYLATPATLRLASTCLEEAPEPAQMFHLLSSTFGVHYQGHPGVTREAQVLALEPYIALLDDGDRRSLADACNDQGWFALRRRLFDAFLDNRYYAWAVEDPAHVFDELVDTRGIHWIDHEIERALRTGATWGDLYQSLLDWLEKRRSRKALKLVAQALISRGMRVDLEAFSRFSELDPDLVADTVYAVRRRNLR